MKKGIVGILVTLVILILSLSGCSTVDSSIDLGGFRIQVGAVDFKVSEGNWDYFDIPIENKGSEAIEIGSNLSIAVNPSERYESFEAGLSWFELEDNLRLDSFETGTYRVTLRVPEGIEQPDKWETWLGVSEIVSKGGSTGGIIRLRNTSN